VLIKLNCTKHWRRFKASAVVQKFKVWRVRNGLSQRQVAAVMGMHEFPVSLFLSQVFNPGNKAFRHLESSLQKSRYSEFRNIPSCRWRSSPILAFHRGELGILKRGEKGQECIIGPISADRGSRWRNPFQCPFLHRKICLDVDVCRLDAFVAKPKSDHGHVDSGLW
jgi:hypothetical protein